MGYSSFKERRCGSYEIEEDYILAVYFDITRTAEARPYGDTVSYEFLTEIDNEEYELNNEPIELGELIIKFGDEITVSDYIDQAIESVI